MSDMIRQLMPASGQIVADGGLYFKLVQSGSPVDVIFEARGSSKKAAQVEAGYQYGPVPEDKRFTRVNILGTPGQFIVAMVSDEYEDYDRIIGVVQLVAPSALADAVDVVVGAAATQIVAANPARRRVTIKSLESSAGNIRVGRQGTVAANRGAQIAPTQSISLETTGAIDGILEGAGAASVCVLEEVF